MHRHPHCQTDCRKERSAREEDEEEEKEEEEEEEEAGWDAFKTRTHTSESGGKNKSWTVAQPRNQYHNTLARILVGGRGENSRPT